MKDANIKLSKRAQHQKHGKVPSDKRQREKNENEVQRDKGEETRELPSISKNVLKYPKI